MQQAIAVVKQIAASRQYWQEQQQQQQQRGRGTRQPAPLTAADPVILLHRFKQCGYHPCKQLLLPLLRAVGPKLHQISLLQAGLLFRAMELEWRDADGCKELLDAGLGRWMVGKSSTASKKPSAAAAAKGSEGSKVVAGGGDLSSSISISSSSGGGVAVSDKVFQLPYWQLKSLIVAAGRFGPLESEAIANAAAAAAAAAGQPASQQESIARLFVGGLLSRIASSSRSSRVSGGSSSSSSRVIGSGSSSSRASWQATPTVLTEWRADMVLALFWAAARLGLKPEPQLLQQGCEVLTARMHRQVSRMIFLQVWCFSCKDVLSCKPSRQVSRKVSCRLQHMLQQYNLSCCRGSHG
jgi:hypothetical protein